MCLQVKDCWCYFTCGIFLVVDILQVKDCWCYFTCGIYLVVDILELGG
jgi:hypothetical protein